MNLSNLVYPIVFTLASLASLICSQTYTVKSVGIVFRNGASTTDDYLYDELSYMDKYQPGTLLPSG
jgi:hypothetical protein